MKRIIGIYRVILIRHNFALFHPDMALVENGQYSNLSFFLINEEINEKIQITVSTQIRA